MSLREHVLRAVIRRSIPEDQRGPWWQAYYEGATERILNDRPPLGLVI